jgi:lipopolysaccharide/colanic/teichoic acid biosynthesis glycosyltransferase
VSLRCELTSCRRRVDCAVCAEKDFDLRIGITVVRKLARVELTGSAHDRKPLILDRSPLLSASVATGAVSFVNIVDAAYRTVRRFVLLHNRAVATMRTIRTTQMPSLKAAADRSREYWQARKRSRRPLQRPVYEWFKRVMDVGICLFLCPFVLPVIAACALAIYIEDPGPVFFRQQRTGRFGRRFNMLKLRTMCKDAEEKKKSLMHLNELTWPDFKISDDPRVLRIGKLLRKTSLDELPQILNVLSGTMSLVGPRPTSFSANTYTLWHTERLEVKPGITGLWQVSGRSDVDFDDRLRLDIQYLRRRSLWFDIKLIYRTISAVVTPKGAY